MNGLPVAFVLPVAVPISSADRLSNLFETHHLRLYRLARRLSSDADDARDLVRETFLRAARAPAAVPFGLPDEEAWLVRVLVNIRRDQWRKAAVRRNHDNEMYAASQVDDRLETVYMARTTVWRALETLPPRRRAIVVMHELEGMGIPAIASLLGISAITVRWHLSKGRRDLARVFNSLLGEKHEIR